jgi:hypothetical protein
MTGDIVLMKMVNLESMLAGAAEMAENQIRMIKGPGSPSLCLGFADLEKGAKVNEDGWKNGEPVVP